MVRRTRELVAAAAGASIIASIPLPWVFSHGYWTGTHPVAFSIEGWERLFLGSVILVAAAMELRSGVSTRWIFLAAGAVGLWTFIGSYLSLPGVRSFPGFDAVTYTMGPGLVMASLGAAMAFVAGALATPRHDPGHVRDRSGSMLGA